MGSEQSPTVPFDWSKHLNKILVQHDQIPLFGRAPSFPWEEFSQKLGEQLELPGIKISADAPVWLEEQQLTEGLGTNLVCLELKVAPLEGKLWWVIDRTSIQRLMTWTLSKGAASAEVALNGDLLTAFYHFAALEAIHHYTQLCGDPELAPSFQLTEQPPTGEALGVDISFEYQVASVRGRLLLSPEFRKSWKKHYDASPRRQMLPPVAQDLPVSIQVEIGHTQLALSDWKKVQPGDLIMLDACSAPPGAEKMRATLKVNNKPIFRARLTDGTIKILELPLTQEG